ncbi:glycosyltransferase family 4 protein [Formosa sp. PL04]|uniref:glycosyltransferase family 4 protein n=1 Tax=Formosa sp. PL04 TaxID=3081755 RepID=UPI002981C5DB|nr:glycosyltransferase family 4 protein [Formosa sp. PL04]MDW5290739.1 glycosyltransferase family 4 protein [Formosa sp. PL04]
MTSKTRIIFTIPNFKTAGSQYVLLAIISKLDHDAFDVFIGVENKPELIPDVVHENRKLNLGFTGDFYKDTYRFAKIITQHKIDIVHSWDYKSNFIEAFACKLAFKTYIYTKKNAAWSKRWFLKSMLSSHIAYNHPEMKSQFFSHWLLRNKVGFIPHGIDLKQFKPNAKPKIKEDGIFKMCCIGNIGDNKNQLYILEQLKALPETIHLYLFGNADPDYLMRCKTYLKKEKLEQRVHFREFVPNNQLATVLNNFDVFLLVSKREGLPVSILEALACGVPVLCSESGGGTNYIFKAGKGGVVFDLSHPLEFKELLLDYVQNKVYFQQKKREAVVVAREFDLLKEVQAYEYLYKKL